MEELFSPGTRETVRNNEMSVFTIKRVSLKRGLTVYAVLQTQNWSDKLKQRLQQENPAIFIQTRCKHEL